MKRIVPAFALLLAATMPATAGGDWYDDEAAYSVRQYRYEDRRVYEVPAYVPHVYVPYGAFYADTYADEPYGQPYLGDRECTIKRKWRHGRMTETIKCDDD